MKSNRSVAPTPSGADAGTADASTRQRVLDLLLESGSLTANELADALELTPAGVRRHLTALVQAGEITARKQEGQRGRGRPAMVYQLTHSGRQSFGEAYDDLALSALAELVAVVGPDAIDRLAEKRLADVETDYLRLRAERPTDHPAELLAEALSAAGYFASTADDGQLCQHHCPVAHVAARYPQLCEVETSVFARLLGTDVSRSATIALGDEACRTHLGLPEPVPTSADRKVSA